MTYYKLYEHVWIDKVCDQYLLFSLSDDDYIPYVRRMNEAAGILCECLVKPCTIEDLQTLLKKTYRKPGNYKKDIKVFIQELVKMGYIEVVE